MGRLSFKHCYKKLFHYNFVCTDHQYKNSFHTVFYKKDNIEVISYSSDNTVYNLACIIDGVNVAFTFGHPWPEYIFNNRYIFTGFKFEHFLDAVCAGKNTEVMEAFRKRDALNTLSILTG